MKNIALITTMILLLSCSQTSKTATEAQSQKSDVVVTASNGSSRPANAFSIFKKEKSAKVVGNVNSSGKFWLFLIKADAWSNKRDVRDSFKVENDGEFRFEIETPDLEEYYIANRGNFFTSIFLEDGMELDLKITGAKNNRTCEFEGKGAEINNFWVDMSKKYFEQQGFDMFYQNLVRDNTPEQFKKKWMKHMEGQTAMIDSFMKTRPKPSKEFEEYARSYVKYGSGGKLITYLYHKPQISKIPNTRYIKAQYEYYDFMEQYDLENETELRHGAMNDFLYSYIIDKEMTGRFAGEPSREYAFNYAKDNLKGEVRDAAAGHLLLDFIENAGTRDEYELLKNLMKEYKGFAGENFVKFVEARFAGKAMLFPGAPAPNFTLEDLSGKQVSLSDYKGKLVVIDFWGTWCGPCRQQLPYSKKIEEKYKDNEDVVFMFVALERGGKGTWKQFVKQNQIPGVHLYSRQDQQLIPYKIESVPRYVIIDKQGMIYNAYASRPSQNMEQQIVKALEES